MRSHGLLAGAAVAALALTPVAPAKPGPDNPGKGHAPKGRNVVAKGVVKSNDGTTLVVTVPASKGKGQGRAGKPSGDVTFTLATTTRLTVADVNGDGAVTAADIAVGDKVVVQAKGDVVRHVVDQTHPPVGDDDADQGDDAPAPAPAPAPTA